MVVPVPKHIVTHRDKHSVIETAKRLDAVVRLQQIAADTRLPEIIRNEASTALYAAGYTPGMIASLLNWTFGTKLRNKKIRTNKSPIKKNALEIKINSASRRKSPSK